MTRARLTLAAVLVLSLASAAACSTGAEDTATQDEFSAAAEGLCRTAAVADDPTAAREIFYDTVHQPLQLADDTATEDRPAAAALLEAKQRVEAALDTSDPSLAAAVDDLVDATSRTLATLDRPPDCETIR